MNWIDAILLVIIVAFCAWGFYKGFIFSILSLFSSFINFVLAIFLTKPLNLLIGQKMGLEGALTNGFASKISSMSAGFSTNLVGMSTADIKTHVSSTLSEANFPFKNLFKSMLRIDGDAIASRGSLTLNDILSKSLGSFFSILISFIIAFVLIWLVLFIIGLISKKAKEVDGIRVTDRILGIVFGLVRATLVIAFIFGILSFFNENGALAPVFDYIKSSAIGGWAYKNVNYLVDKYINFKTITAAIKGFI